jgi:hypothetical protein
LNADKRILFLADETKDFTDLIAQQMGIDRPEIIQPVNGAVFGSNYILTYTVTTYNSVPAERYTTETIEYYAYDRASLFAPIQTVQYTRTDNYTSVFIIQNGISILSGYQDFLNPLDAVKEQDYEDALTAIEKQNVVAITLDAGSEYSAFNPNPTTYLLNAMDIDYDADYVN